MKIRITRKYLKLPVRPDLPEQYVLFYLDGELVYDLKAPLALQGEEGAYTAYILMDRFAGQTLDIVADPETDLGKFRSLKPGTLLNPTVDFPFAQSDTLDTPDLYREPWRPQAHFTVPVGHNNDVNGFMYYQGRYHLFCQHNPAEPAWGNMHWYHTVSTDLCHWEAGDEALFPDERGMIYSGCGFVDERNLTGLGTEGNPAMLLYYTAAAQRTRMAPIRNAEQCLAWSLDGKTFTKYAGNPLIPRMNDSYNRDPKVVWAEEIGKYLMVLYLAEGVYRMMASTDLLHWELLTDYRIGKEEECPEIFPLWYEGKKYWVLMGFHDVYVLAHFNENGALVYDTEPQKLTAGQVAKAAQACAGLPDNRVVRVSWQHLYLPGARITSQIGLPVEMRLEPSETGLQLCAAPVREYESLRKNQKILQNVTVDGTRSLPAAFPCEVQILADWDPAAKLKLEAFGWTADIDMAENRMTVSSPKDVTMPLSHDKKQLKLRLFIDAASVELFADEGRYPLNATLACWQGEPALKLTSDRPMTIREIDYYELEKIRG